MTTWSPTSLFNRRAHASENLSAAKRLLQNYLQFSDVAILPTKVGYQR
jgi:hypothetical protein